MGLDYLQKKNWHPGSMRNREEVWLREQLQKEIMKKELERSKKLQEEKHNEELKRLQVEAGLIPKSHLERMEWMYEWGNKLHQQQKSAEEYLMGKPISVDEAEKIAKEKQKGNQPPIFKEEVTNAKCEDFSKIHEDPLYFILSGEQKVQQDFYANPLRVKHTIDQIENKKIKKDKKQKKEQNDISSSDEGSKKSTSGMSKTSVQNNKAFNIKQSSGGGTGSKIYQQYLQQRLGNILVKDDQGNIKPDFGLMKRKNKPQFQDQEKDRMRQKMKSDAQDIQNEKSVQYDKLKMNEEQQTKGTGDNFIQEARKQVYDSNRNDALGERMIRNRNSLNKILGKDQ